MNDRELSIKVNSSMYRQCRNRGYATAVDVLMEIGYLSQKDYENWRHGRVPYLERVCMANLSKLSAVRHQMRVYARKTDLNPSFCYYKQWAVKKEKGHRPVIPLRFSKSGDPEIERQYATHFVDRKRIEQLKATARGANEPSGQPEVSSGGSSDGASSSQHS